jgi:hypothetical protein
MLTQNGSMVNLEFTDTSLLEKMTANPRRGLRFAPPVRLLTLERTKGRVNDKHSAS